MKRILLLGGLALVLPAAAMRLADMPAGRWHADPDTAMRSGDPNDYLVGPGGDRPSLRVEQAPIELARMVDAVALAEPRTVRIAGRPEDGWTTYVQRSALMGFPDAISVKVVPDGAGARLSIWSRSRFGKGDMGVNRRRVERWLAALRPGEGARGDG